MNKNILKITTILCSLSVLPGSVIAQGQQQERQQASVPVTDQGMQQERQRK